MWASSSGLRSGRVEFLERLRQTLQAVGASARPANRAAAQSRRRTLSRPEAARRLQRVQRPSGETLWTQHRYKKPIKSPGFTKCKPQCSHSAFCFHFCTMKMSLAPEMSLNSSSVPNFQGLHSSPAWSLPRGDPSMTTTGTLSTPGTSHIVPPPNTKPSQSALKLLHTTSAIFKFTS